MQTVKQPYAIYALNALRFFYGRQTALIGKVRLYAKSQHRRHLNSSQKAVIAERIEPLLAEEAKERLKLSQGRGKKGVEIIPQVKGKAREQAANTPISLHPYSKQVPEIQ